MDNIKKTWSLEEEKQFLQILFDYKQRYNSINSLSIEIWNNITEMINKIRNSNKTTNDIIDYYNKLKEKYQVLIYIINIINRIIQIMK